MVSLLNETPKFLITQYLDDNLNDLENLKKKLYEMGVLTKYYDEDKLLLIYHKYDTPIKNPLQRECRSLVIDTNTFKIKSYSCENPFENDDGVDYLINYPINKKKISVCYEGTYISVFNNNSKWYASTRRCLNSCDSEINNISHFTMMEEVLKNAGYENFNSFTQELDKTLSYYFVLVHHKNQHFVNYEKVFDDKEYAKLFLASVKDETLKELELYEFNTDFVDYENIYIPESLASIDEFVSNNRNIYDTDVMVEGIIIRIFNKEMQKYNLIKLQYSNYRFIMSIGANKNIYKGLLYLYQNNKLINYFEKNQNMTKINEYDTLGVINSVFTVCTSELFELFKKLWSISSGKKLNDYLYSQLPKEYKDILYYIRGIYFKKKALRFTDSKFAENKNSFIKSGDIYNYLKSLDTNIFVSFLRIRTTMFNTVKTKILEDPTDLQLADFLTISKYCDETNIKLCNLYSLLI